MKKDVLNKKKVIIALLCVLLLASIVFLILFLFGKDASDTPSEEKQDEIHYHLPSYEENIFENKAYMEFQRDLVFGIGGVEQVYSYDEIDAVDGECKFFLSYFQAVIQGDYEKYPDFFFEGALEDKPKFTMQMIYEPYVKFHSESKDEMNGEEVLLRNFIVQYKIFKNNGTFRKGVSSNTVVPQIYQLAKSENGDYKIHRILEIEVQE